jgi:hypothetical protein
MTDPAAESAAITIVHMSGPHENQVRSPHSVETGSISAKRRQDRQQMKKHPGLRKISGKRFPTVKELSEIGQAKRCARQNGAQKEHAQRNKRNRKHEQPSAHQKQQHRDRSYIRQEQQLKALNAKSSHHAYALDKEKFSYLKISFVHLHFASQLIL